MHIAIHAHTHPEHPHQALWVIFTPLVMLMLLSALVAGKA